MKNTWRNNLRPASWRGVAFVVGGDASEFGRNVAVHEFAQRDRPALTTRQEMVAARHVTASITGALVVRSGLQMYPQTQAALPQLRTDAAVELLAEVTS